MKQNIRELDFLRAIAAFLVIAIHVVSGRINTSKIAFAWDVAMISAVPIFIILSGYLLHYSYKDKEQLGFLDFMKKRLSKIFIPYLIWTIIYMIYSLNWNYKEIFTLGFIGKLLENLILGKGFVHLYFMVIIIQLYFIYPLLKKLALKNIKLTLALSFAISLYFNLEPYLRLHGVNILPVDGRPYYFVFLGRWIFYFVLGVYFAANSQKLMKIISTSKIELAIIWTLLLISVVFLSNSLGMGNQILNSLTIIYSISSFLLLYSICYFFKENYSRWTLFLEWFSKQSFIIYLSHLLLIRLILLKISTIHGTPIWKGGIGLIFFLLASVVLSSIFAYVISFTPLAGFLVGVRKAKEIKYVPKMVHL